MRRNLLLGYLVFVHLFLVLVLVKSDFTSRVGKRFGLIKRAEHEITSHFEKMIKYHRRMDANVPNGAVVFIGDSLIQGLCVAAVVTPSVNYGIGGDTTVGVLQRLPDYHSLERASGAVIAIGVNDFMRRGNEEILKNYSLILQALPEDLPVLFSAVLPVDERIDQALAGKNNRINALNSGLKALCHANGHKCTFIDPGPNLMDSSHNLSNNYHDGDGLHLNGVGNSLWIQELKEGIKKAQRRAQAGPKPCGAHSVVLSESSLTSCKGISEGDPSR